MVKKFSVYIALVLVYSVLCIGTVQSSEKIIVFVSVAPQKFFVQQIGMDQVDVHVMVSPGASPATYEPKPSQMASLSRATLYFAIGVPFENVWLDKIAAANPDMKIIRTDQDIPKIPMVSHGPENDQHPDPDSHDHESDDHRHEGLDPHIWLAPPLVMEQARTISNALQAADPSNRDFYRENHAQFHLDLVSLHEDISRILSSSKEKKFMVFHPSWGYFAKTYQLEQIPIEVEGKDPKPAQLRQLITHARKNRIEVVFVQPQFSSRSAGLVAREISGIVAIADPLAENWDENLKMLAEKFKAAAK